MGIIQRQSIKASIATYLGIVIGAVNLMILFPRWLTQEQLGLTRVLIAVAILFSQAALLGAPFALIRYFPFFKVREQKHHGFAALMMLMVLAGFMVVGLLVFIFRHPVEHLYDKRSPLFAANFSWIFPLALFMVLSELFFYYCRALLKLPIPVFFREVMLRIAQTVAVFLFYMKWISFQWMIALFVGSYLLQLLLLTGYVFWLKEFFFFTRIHLERKVPLNQILRYSFITFAAVSAAIYTQNIDVILLGYLLNLDNTAIYSIAFFIGTIVQIPARNMNMVAATIVAEAWKEQDFPQIQKLYSQTSLTQLLIGGFIFLLVWFNVDLILSFIPKDYSGAKPVIFMIGLGKLFDMATGINGEIINTSKHVKVNLFTNLLLIVISTAMNFWLIAVYGIMGAAIATAVSVFFFNAIRMVFLYYEYRLQPFEWASGKGALLLLVCFGVGMVLPSTGHVWVDSVYRSAILIVLFVSPLIYLKISPEINAAFRSAISSVKK
jgi:O-antigen/teichoic acid export membrane protein